MATSPLDAAPPTFSMLLPEAWQQIDFDPETRDESIERMIRRTVGQADALVPVRRWAVDTYGRLLADAETTGIFFGANFTGELGGRILSASVLAFVTDLPLAEDGYPMSPRALAAALAHPDNDDEQTVEPPQVVELHVGTSVRTRTRLRVRPAGAVSGVPEVEAVRFFTPVSEWRLMLVITFSTPVLSAAGAFAELFDSLAATARWKD